MTFLLLTLPSALLGATAVGIFGLPFAERRGYNRGVEARRVLDGPALLREDLPVQSGTVPMPQRRARPPLQYVEITDASEVWQPAEPHQTPGQLEPEFDVPWPRWWRLLWPVLLFAAHFWYTPTGVRLDRLCVALGRRERRYFAQHRHATNALEGEAERRRRALLEPTQELPYVDLLEVMLEDEAAEPLLARIGELVTR